MEGLFSWICRTRSSITICNLILGRSLCFGSCRCSSFTVVAGLMKDKSIVILVVLFGIMSFGGVVYMEVGTFYSSWFQLLIVFLVFLPFGAFDTPP